MLQHDLARHLKSEMEAAISFLPDVAGLRDLVRSPLAKAKRGLAREVAEGPSWPLLPLLVCVSICGRYEQALPATAALQFLIAACDVFDDVEDADSTESLSAKHGPAVATNVATALLFLGEKAIGRSKEKGVPFNHIQRVCEEINSSYLAACAGQHLDLSLTVDKHVSEEGYMQIVSMKSAVQIQCACRIGALLADANLQLVEAFSKFGYNLGMAAQIANDIQGTTSGSDIARRKITLPVVYAIANGGESFRRDYVAQTDASQIRDTLFRLGAVHYSTAKLHLYKQGTAEAMFDAIGLGASAEPLTNFLD